MSYIEYSDITDSVVRAFGETTVTPYITKSDYQVNDVAEQLGITDTDQIETDPVHFKIKEYAIAYVGREVCMDKMGMNNNNLPVEIEKYAVKYKLYREKVLALRKELSLPMFNGTVDQAKDRATYVGTFYRT